MHTIQIPFGGFYESKWSGEIDQILEREIEHFEEQENEKPQELRIDASKISDIFYDVANFSNAYPVIARHYVESFNDHISEEIGFQLAGKFDGMDSPKYYNFETDRLYMKVPSKTVKALFALSKKDKHETLARVIKERHTSRSGFHSYYDNDLESWLDKPVLDWDHNELESLLLAVMELREVDSDYDWTIYYGMAESEIFYNAFSDCVNWTHFEERMNEERAELLEELTAENPEYVPPYRCAETRDLFANH